jgi:hypothetical protein
MAVKRPNGHKIYQHLPLLDPPKFTQIWIFCLKICHLATLGRGGAADPFRSFPIANNRFLLQKGKLSRKQGDQTSP